MDYLAQLIWQLLICTVIVTVFDSMFTVPNWMYLIGILFGYTIGTLTYFMQNNAKETVRALLRKY